MTRQLVTIYSPADKAKAWNCLKAAVPGTRLEIKAPKRSLPQNDRLWLILSKIAKMEWRGERYTESEWKDFFMSAYRGEKWMPDEDGRMVVIGRSTSDLSKQEFGELLELIEAFCARQNINLPWVEA